MGADCQLRGVDERRGRPGKSPSPPGGGDGAPLTLEGPDALDVLAEENRRTIPRGQLARHQGFSDISGEVGEIDSRALAELIDEDIDHALALLTEMSVATDRRLAALAARLAGRLVLDVARGGPVGARGVGKMVSSAADRFDGDLDLERSIEALVAAEAAGISADMADLRVRRWTKPVTAIALVVDRSGSMSGQRLATAAVAAAACSYRVPNDWSALVFADRILVLKSQQDAKAAPSVVDSLLRLRGQGTTDLAGALAAAADQLDRSRAKRRVVILLSDCRATTGVDPVAAARRLDELAVLAPADDATDAKEFAAKVGARFAVIDGPAAIPAAVTQVIA
ncbi:MAG: VWA domain-containing protein [Acidimicrobiaceae bacterium]|nr:VWA domain-containing protein [Acidimicrobiaceae bacterium]